MVPMPVAMAATPTGDTHPWSSGWEVRASSSRAAQASGPSWRRQARLAGPQTSELDGPVLADGVIAVPSSMRVMMPRDYVDYVR